MGASAEKSQLIFDTGSTWLVVASSKCSNCGGSVYTVDNSKISDSAELNIKYGSANLNGIQVHDKVCVGDYGASSSSLCLDDFKFVAISSQEGLSPSKGIFGLGPYNKNDDNPHKAFIPELFTNGKITQNKVSFAMGYTLKGSSTPSFADFGEPDDTYYTGEL